MTSDENLLIAKNWIEAFNTKNIVALLLLYDDQAKHYSPKLKISKPETNGLIVGKSNLKQWWDEAFNNLPSLQYKPTSFTTDATKAFIEYTRKVDGEADLFVAEVLEINNGKIQFSRVYHG